MINSKDGRDFARPIFMPNGRVEHILVPYMDIYILHLHDLESFII